MSRKYDVAAYIWPAYTGDEPRTRPFWPQGMGEWQSVRSAGAKFEGHDWPRRPLWGYVNEADPTVMQMEIEAAVSHGVNVFIYDWYWYDDRPFLEQCLDNGFLGAPNRDKMQFYLMWANHDATQGWDKRISDDYGDTVLWQGSQTPETFRKITRYWIDRYFQLPNYYRIDGKPVVMIYDVVNLIKGLGGVDATRRALDEFREEAVRAGLPGVHLQMTVWWEGIVDLSGVDKNHRGSSKDCAVLLGFDSITHYQFAHYVDVSQDYCAILEQVKAEWARIDREYPMPYFPGVSVGWDNNPRFERLRPAIMQNTTPENIQKGFQMAKDYLDAHPDRPPLVVINSWNEWTETSYLQPDDKNGYGYLDAVRAVFGQSV